jgi:chromosomal replication initiation ATPase DnaA
MWTRDGKLRKLNQDWRAPITTNPYDRRTITTEGRQLITDVIIPSVEHYFALKQGVIFAYGRKRTAAKARQIAMALAKAHTEMTYEEMSDVFNRDADNIRYAYRVVQEDRHMTEMCEYLSNIFDLDHRNSF